ncbi:hypothetical protein [Natrialba taiwanensis]|nr:hypothetical protein [Natrialba taiwanensis]
MTTTWGDLFERGASYDVDLDRIRTTADELDDRPASSSGERDD